MIRCKDCRHWRKDHEWYWRTLEKGFGVCGLIEHHERDDKAKQPAAVNDAETITAS